MDWISLIQTLGGIVGGFGIGAFSKSRRRKDKAEADKAVKDVYEERLSDLHEVVTKLNDTERAHAQRIAELNKALDDKTDRIRALTDRMWEAEREINRVNDLLTAEQRRTSDLEREAGNLRVLVEHYKLWHCRRNDCGERVPPNDKLRGMRYDSPERK